LKKREVCLKLARSRLPQGVNAMRPAEDHRKVSSRVTSWAMWICLSGVFSAAWLCATWADERVVPRKGPPPKFSAPAAAVPLSLEVPSIPMPRQSQPVDAGNDSDPQTLTAPWWSDFIV